MIPDAYAPVERVGRQAEYEQSDGGDQEGGHPRREVGKGSGSQDASLLFVSQRPRGQAESRRSSDGHIRSRLQRRESRSQSERPGGGDREGGDKLWAASRAHRVRDASPLFVSERSRGQSEARRASDAPGTQRSHGRENVRERPGREARSLIPEINEDESSTRKPRKKIKTTEQVLQEAREILKQRQADRKAMTEKEALEARLFRANAPPPKLFAAPSTLREQGLEEISRKEKGRVHKSFNPNLTNPIDRHERNINRTDMRGSWGSETKMPTWEERMAYVRTQSPPGSRPPVSRLDDDDTSNRVRLPIAPAHSHGSKRNRQIRGSVSASRPIFLEEEFHSLREQSTSDSSVKTSTNVRTTPTKQSVQPPPQSHAPMRSERPAPYPDKLSRGTPGRERVRIPAPEPVLDAFTAPTPKSDWRAGEWMAQYQAQADDDPLAKFYGQ